MTTTVPTSLDRLRRRRRLLRHRGHAVLLALLGVLLALVTLQAATTQGLITGILFLIGALLLVLLLAEPERAATLVVTLVYSNAVVIATRDHGVPGIAQYLVLLLLLLPLAQRVFLRRGALILPSTAIWALVLLVIQAAGAMLAREPDRSLAALQTTAIEGVVLFFLVTNAVRGWHLVRQVTLAVVLTAGLLGGLTFLHELTDPRKGDYAGFSTISKAVVDKDNNGGKVRHTGPIGEQNRWAQVLAVVLPLGIALTLTDRSRAARAAAGLASLGIVVGILLTYSRGAAVGLLATGCIALVLRWVRAGPTLAVAVVGLLLLSAVNPTFVARTTGLTSAGDQKIHKDGRVGTKDGSYGNRVVEAKAAFGVFADNPILGVGPGMFRTYFQEHARLSGTNRLAIGPRQAHNLYLGLAADAGVLGLLAFTGVCVSVLRPLGRRRREYRHVPDRRALTTGYLCAIITYLTTGMFLHFAYVRYFWLLLALATAAALAATDLPTDPVPGPPEPRRRPNEAAVAHVDDAAGATLPLAS